MTITTIASQLLTHFAPEQRSIPDSGTYSGCNGAVLAAMNGALQEMFTAAAPWVRRDERGLLLHAPATSVSIDVTHGATAAVISADTWQDWFAGCAIVIDGGSITNQIRNNARQVELKFPYDGATAGSFASATIDPSGSNNSITVTAATAGASGNALRFQILTPATGTSDTIASVSESIVTLTPGDKARMIISGVATSNVNGSLGYCGVRNGFDSWSSDGINGIFYQSHGIPYTVLWKSGSVWCLQRFESNGTPSYQCYCTDTGISPSGLTFDAPGIGSGIPTIASSASTSAQGIVAINSTPATSALMVASNAPGSDGSGALSSVSLTPFTGGSDIATKTATVYQTSLDLPSDVMGVYRPVRAGNLEISPMVAESSAGHLGRGGDFGRGGVYSVAYDAMMGPGVAVGRPMFYEVGSWSAGDTEAPGIRLSLVPASDTDSIFTYAAKLAPPVITDLSSTATLPIPLQFVESIFMPLALQRLQSSPFFVDNGHADEIARAYKQAKTDLANLNPRRNAGTRMRSLY